MLFEEPYREESSELDLNIKEALETLKKQDGTPRRRSMSPAEPLHSRKPAKSECKKIIDEHLQLQEFIQTEQAVKSEVRKVTIHLRKPGKENQPPKTLLL